MNEIAWPISNLLIVLTLNVAMYMVSKLYFILLAKQVDILPWSKLLLVKPDASVYSLCSYIASYSYNIMLNENVFG